MLLEILTKPFWRLWLAILSRRKYRLLICSCYFVIVIHLRRVLHKCLFMGFTSAATKMHNASFAASLCSHRDILGRSKCDKRDHRLNFCGVVSFFIATLRRMFRWKPRTLLKTIQNILWVKTSPPCKRFWTSHANCRTSSRGIIF